MAVKHSAELTFYDVSDNYNVTLTNEAATFKATSDTKLGTAGTATTKPQAFQGTDAVACTVAAADCVRSDATNVTVTVNSSGDNATWPLVTITVGANATAGGTVEIPVVCGTGDDAVTIVKVFSYSIALKGTPGTNGTSVSVSSIKYTTSSSESQPADSAFTSTTVPTVPENSWLWTMVTFSNGSKLYSKAKQGKGGTNGTSYYTHIRYGTSASGAGMTATPTASTAYIGLYTGTSSTAPTSASSYTWSKYHGEDGDNPYTLALTSSDGSVFRNNTGSKTITCHIYQKGAELAAVPTGHAVKWYKDGTYLTGKDGLTLDISAGDVDRQAVFVAKLEG